MNIKLRIRKTNVINLFGLRVLLISFVIMIFNLAVYGQTNIDSTAKYEFENYYKVMINYDTEVYERENAYNLINHLAENGNNYAISFLACHLLQLRGVENNNLIEKGIEYAKRSIDENILSVSICLALYYYGQNEIDKYYEALLIGLTNESVKVELGYFLITGTSLISKQNGNNPIIFTRYVDTNEGIKILEEASGLNNVEAKFILGKMYYQGLYIVKDLKKAKELFTDCRNHSEFDFFYWHDEVEEYLEDLSEI